MRPTLLALLVIGLPACDDPLAFREPPPLPRQVTIMAVVDPDRTLQHVYVDPLNVRVPLRNIRGRLYEDGRLVATDFIPSLDHQAEERLGRCASQFGSYLGILAGTCLEFAWWPRYGSVYRVEVEADGVEVASGETTVPGAFDVSTITALGFSPPGADGLSADWTSSDGAHMYVVAVRAEFPNCSGGGCRTGWYAETTSTSLEATIPPDHFTDSDRAGYVIEVLALNRELYEYLTTGASGSLFPVPPVENVTGGRGVVGAWVRRPAHQKGGRWAQDPVVERGDWEVLPYPDDDALHQMALLDGGMAGMAVRGYQGVHYSPLSEAPWHRVFAERPYQISSVGSAAYFSASFSVYAFLADAEPAVEEIATFRSLVALFHASARDPLLLVRLRDAGDGLLRSMDGGTSFDTVRLPAIPEGQYDVVDLTEDPAEGTLYAVLSLSQPSGAPAFRVARSTDRGATWTADGDVAPWRPFRVVAGASVLYALVQGPGEPGVLTSSDEGRTWSRALHALVTSLHVENGGERVWIGTGSVDSEETRTWSAGGVLVSEDAGATFRPFGLAGASVVDIAVTGDRADLYVLSMEKGVLRHRLDPEMGSGDSPPHTTSYSQRVREASIPWL